MNQEVRNFDPITPSTMFGTNVNVARKPAVPDCIAPGIFDIHRSPVSLSVTEVVSHGQPIIAREVRAKKTEQIRSAENVIEKSPRKTSFIQIQSNLRMMDILNGNSFHPDNFQNVQFPDVTSLEGS